MLTKERIKDLLGKLNALLAERSEVGGIGLVGWAVMCVVYNARVATRDVDAIFEPAPIIRELAAQIAATESLPPDWLSDAAKGFITPGFERQEVSKPIK